MFHWGGETHWLPENYKFPKELSIYLLWNSYLFGNVRDNIPPCHYVQRGTATVSKAQRPYMSKIRFVMDFFLEKAKELELGTLEQITASGSGRANLTFNRVLSSIFPDAAVNGNKVAMLTYITIYKKLHPADKHVHVIDN